MADYTGTLKDSLKSWLLKTIQSNHHNGFEDDGSPILRSIMGREVVAVTGGKLISGHGNKFFMENLMEKGEKEF